MPRHKEFMVDDVPVTFTEHLTTGNLNEARRVAKNLINEGYLARITKVTEPTAWGRRSYYVVWQRGKLGVKGRIGYGLTEAIFGRQRRPI